MSAIKIVVFIVFIEKTLLSLYEKDPTPDTGQGLACIYMPRTVRPADAAESRLLLWKI